MNICPFKTLKHLKRENSAFDRYAVSEQDGTQILSKAYENAVTKPSDFVHPLILFRLAKRCG